MSPGNIRSPLKQAVDGDSIKVKAENIGRFFFFFFNFGYIPCAVHYIPVSYLFINLFIYLSMAVLGLHCCTWAFSSCGKRGPLFPALCRFLNSVACFCCRARALGTQAQ